MNAYNELHTRIATKPDWLWARSSGITSPLDEAQKEVMAFKASHEFWTQWAMRSSGTNFNSYAKEPFNMEVMKGAAREVFCLRQLDQTLGGPGHGDLTDAQVPPRLSRPFFMEVTS